MTPQSPWGEACKLLNLPIVYVMYLLLGSMQTFFDGGDVVLGVDIHRKDLLW